MIHLSDINSSLIKSIEYDAEECEITFFFVDTYFIDKETYVDFSYQYFEEMLDNKAKSFGKFYLHFIKQNFKLKSKNMADKPKSKNESSDKKRFIQIRLDVNKIEKEWIVGGIKGNYLDITLMLMPNGTVDKYGSLGMVVQKVPKSVWEKDKKIQGEILGNGYEYDWNSGAESQPGVETDKKLTQEEIDDLPF